MNENLFKEKKSLTNEKKSLTNGLLALALIGLVALGCTCNQEGGLFGNKQKSDTNSSQPGAPTDTKETFEKADASKGEIPSNAEMQEIVKSTLLSFNDALRQKDFSDFHKTIADAWQRQTTPKTFEEGFGEFIRKGVDISNIRSQKADFTTGPQFVTQDGLERLKVAGSYPTSPRPTRFDLQYIAEGSDWKLFAIEVDTTGK